MVFRPKFICVPLLVVAMLGSIVMLRAGLANASDPPNSASSHLPELQKERFYKLPSTKFTGTLAEPLIGDAATAVAWSNDGKRLAAFSSYGQNLTVWNSDGSVVNVLHPVLSYLNNSLVFLNDNELLTPPQNTVGAPPGDRRAFDIWNVQTGSVVKNIAGPEPEKIVEANSATVYAISPDRSMVATLAQKSGIAKIRSEEFQENDVPIYSTKTWQIIQCLPIVWPGAIAFSPDGKQIAFGGNFFGNLSIYDTTTWQLVKSIQVCEGFSPSINTMAYSPDGNFIAVGMTINTDKPNTCGVRIFRVNDGAVLGSYPDDKAAGPRKLLWHPGGKFIVFAPHDRTLRLWNPNNPNDLGTIVHDVNSMCLAFSPDAKQLASCNDGGVTVFNIHF